ncbi:hypothetical protein [Microcoleus asticus]|nr:hypothetical protein [Microcoleus asticus]
MYKTTVDSFGCWQLFYIEWFLEKVDRVLDRILENSIELSIL